MATDDDSERRTDDETVWFGRRARLRRCCLGLLFAVIGAGLAGPAEAADERKRMSQKIGERVSRGVVEESLDVLDREENRERLGRIMNSPQMRAAMHDLSQSIVLGVVHGIRRAQAESGRKRIDVGASVGEALEKHVAPAAGKLTYRIVDSALTASLSDKHIAQLGVLGKHTTHAVLAGVGSGVRDEVGPALATTLDHDIGPAVARMIERDVLPSVGRGLDSPEMQAAVANTTRTIATELVSSTADAMSVEQERKEASGRESRLQVFGTNIAVGYAVALFLAFAFGTTMIVLGVLLVRSHRRQRDDYEAAEQREATLMNLIARVESDHPELRADMQQLVRGQLRTPRRCRR